MERRIIAVRPDAHDVPSHSEVGASGKPGAVQTVINVTLRAGTQIIAAVGADRIYAPSTEIGLRFNPSQARFFAEDLSAKR